MLMTNSELPKAWEQSYKNGDNNLFYPDTEVVRFINRYICKRNVEGSITRIFNKKSKRALKGLDFACGSGSNCLIFNDFNIKGYGVDISHTAINIAKKRSINLQKDNLEFLILDKENQKLPFKNNFFDFTIAESCLDSMPYLTAKNYLKELKRITKGLIYISLIGFDDSIQKDEFIVNTKLENGTIQSVYNIKKILDLFEIKVDDFESLYRKDIINPINSKNIGTRYYCIINSV